MHVTEALDASPIRRRLVEVLAALPEAMDAPSVPQSGSASDAERVSPRARGMTAVELAEIVGRHPTSVRVQLDRLIDLGLVTATDRVHGVGRPRRFYALALDRLPEPTGEMAFRQLSGALATMEHEGLSAREAGRLWAHTHAEELLGPQTGEPAPSSTITEWFGRLGQLLEMFSRWGYVPDVTTSREGRDAHLCLTQCPLRSLAEDNLALACSMHAGLIEGVLDAMGEDSVELELVPFAQSHLCRATLVHHSLTLPEHAQPVTIRKALA